MKINNNSIQGIFVYSDSAEYEKGDFIVDGDLLYICTASNPTSFNEDSPIVQGHHPSLDKENFIVYLGNKIADADEFYSYVNDPTQEDKYLSSLSLGNILNHYMMGFDEKGIIRGENEILDISPDSPEEIIEEAEDGTQDPMYKILISPEINNAIYYISRDAECIKKLGILPEEELGDVPEESKTKHLILRQYTYQESMDCMVRVQELLDLEGGQLRYRWLKNSSSNSLPSSWRSLSNPKSEVSIIFQLDFLRNYMTQKINDLEITKKGLEGNFSFREISTHSNTVTLTCDPKFSSIKYFVDFGKSYEEGFSYNQPKSMVIDVVVRFMETRDGNTYWKSKSCTVDLRDCVSPADNPNENIISSYYIDDNTILGISISSDYKEAKLELTSNNSSAYEIVNIYYRRQYEYDPSEIEGTIS